MPIETPPAVPSILVRGTIGRRFTYSENEHGPIAYTRKKLTEPPKPPVWDMQWPANQIAAIFLDLTPAERATWTRPAARAAFPTRTFFMRYNLARYNWSHGSADDITRTFP